MGGYPLTAKAGLFAIIVPSYWAVLPSHFLMRRKLSEKCRQTSPILPSLCRHLQRILPSHYHGARKSERNVPSNSVIYAVIVPSNRAILTAVKVNPFPIFRGRSYLRFRPRNYREGKRRLRPFCPLSAAVFGDIWNTGAESHPGHSSEF